MYIQTCTYSILLKLLLCFSRSESEDGRSTDNAGTLQRDVAEVERDLSLRRLLWESSDQWTSLVKEWVEQPFHRLNVDDMQKTVSKLMQTIFLLEKGTVNHGTYVEIFIRRITGQPLRHSTPPSRTHLYT